MRAPTPPDRHTVASELAPARAFSENLSAQAVARILEALPDLAFICVDGKIRCINQSGFFLLGGTPGRTVLGVPFKSFITDDYADIVDDFLEMIATDQRPTALRVKCLDGAVISVRMSVNAIPEIGEHSYLVTGQDITQQVELTDGINRSEHRFRKLVGNAQNLICVCDNGKITYINDAGIKLLKADKASSVEGLTLEKFLHADYREIAFLTVDELLETHEMIPARLVDSQGRGIDVALSFTLLERVDGQRSRYMIEARDITAQNRAVTALRQSIESLEQRVGERTRELQEEVAVRRSAEEKMRHMASHDVLTGLPNRALLVDRLDVAIRRARREKGLCAVAFIDLDGFKAINDTLGHEAGDQLLQAVAGILTQCTRETDTVARIGGDEFVLVLPDLLTPGGAEIVARRVLEALAAPVELAGGEARVGASIGISCYPANGKDPDALVKAADGAMYAVKGKSKNSFIFAA